MFKAHFQLSVLSESLVVGFVSGKKPGRVYAFKTVKKKNIQSFKNMSEDKRIRNYWRQRTKKKLEFRVYATPEAMLTCRLRTCVLMRSSCPGDRKPAP